MKIVAIVQARMGSTRLPNKVMNMIGGMPMIEILLSRLSHSTEINQILLATSKDKRNISLIDHVQKLGYICICGSENDVLNRYLVAAKKSKADIIVRITGDCPLIDPILVDKLIKFTYDNNIDYCSNTLIENYPDGQDIEVFKFSALEVAWENAILSSDREHVTPYIRNNSDFKGANIFKALNYPCASNYSKIRMTVDEPRDFDLIKILIKDLGTNKTWLEYTNHIIKNDLNKINNSIIRNEGLLKSLKNV